MDLDPAGTKESTDAELMAGLAAGEDLALSLLMHRWRDRVASFLHKMTGHPDIAADLVQETFVKLYLARNRYRPAGKFSTYLFAIAANLGRNQARWHARHPTVSLDMPRDQAGAVPEPAAAGPSPGETAATEERAREVFQAFRELPPDLREAMSLFIYEDLGYAEIAQIAGCSAKAVETRIYRARQLLKERLKSLLSQG